ncbi:Hypothetical predicted protein [Octopus vulgaris]|uniref:Secreted protein n=1 Tax=Octopus vulgaris TaxID=6645 RepID=A0AA36AX64_OCTVU|nr:Hypothetical predicted protein [Octopus vulgaris]
MVMTVTVVSLVIVKVALFADDVDGDNNNRRDTGSTIHNDNIYTGIAVNIQGVSDNTKKKPMVEQCLNRKRDAGFLDKRSKTMMALSTNLQLYSFHRKKFYTFLLLLLLRITSLNQRYCISLRNINCMYLYR